MKYYPQYKFLSCELNAIEADRGMLYVLQIFMRGLCFEQILDV